MKTNKSQKSNFVSLKFASLVTEKKADLTPLERFTVWVALKIILFLYLAHLFWSCHYKSPVMPFYEECSNSLASVLPSDDSPSEVDSESSAAVARGSTVNVNVVFRVTSPAKLIQLPWSSSLSVMLAPWNGHAYDKLKCFNGIVQRLCLHR